MAHWGHDWILLVSLELSLNFPAHCQEGIGGGCSGKLLGVLKKVHLEPAAVLANDVSPSGWCFTSFPNQSHSVG